jgi:hypothetical protein
MNLSIQTRLGVVFQTAFLLASVHSANAQSALTIQSASANAGQTILSIAGSNYCATPTVTLGGASLPVLTSTPALITASLSPLTPGTYYLVVSCGTLAGRTAYFNVSIGGQAAPRAAAAGGCWVKGQRYADCGNGTVTDSVTGLIWLKDAACPSLGTPDYVNGNAAARGLRDGQCGLSDGSVAGEWRLPTRDEWLATLTARGFFKTATETARCVLPALRANDGMSCYATATAGPGPAQHAFLNVVSGGYWSSSTYEVDPSYTYVADLSVANLSDDNLTLPRFRGDVLFLNVWPVRGGSK